MIPAALHGILCHYFHGGNILPAQGSLSVDDFQRGLDAYGDRLIPAKMWLHKALTGQLTNECVVTLDDGLYEQMLIVPVLERRSLTAFWNVYTGPLIGVPNGLEVCRWIRNHAFGSVEKFYEVWKGAWYIGMPSDYLADYGYLTEMDRMFRFWRNGISPAEYARVMFALAEEAGAELPQQDYWLNAEDLRYLHHTGHVLGIHTHSHPSTMTGLSFEQQTLEYATSRYILAKTLNVHETKITVCAHPCGSYTEEGVRWLQAGGFQMAWGSKIQGSVPWNVPRYSTGYWRLND